MAPPKATTAKSATKKTSPPEHPPYKEMVKEAILALKERNGSSRPALKKYIKANYKGVDNDRFDGLFNAAVKKGADNNEFSFPKGPSGTVKLVKKEPVKKAPKKTATPVKAAKKPTAKAAPKASTKATTAKPTAKPSTKTSAKPSKITGKTTKANLGKTRKVEDKKTKTGRVTKAAAKPKKATPKKATN